MVEEHVDINGTPHKPHKDKSISMDCPLVARRTKRGCFILASVEGVIFNPNNPEFNLTDKDKKRGCPLFQLQQCSEKCYESYKLFLKTKNKTHLILTERRFLNG